MHQSKRTSFFDVVLPGLFVVTCLSCGPGIEPSPHDETAQPSLSMSAGALSAQWTAETPLPKAITNNAVAGLTLDDTTFLFSFLGLDGSKIYTGITREAFTYDTKTKEWTPIRPVPGAEGRIAATAQGLGGKVYIFGGYTVDANGQEVSVPDVNIYDPRADAYSSGAPIPVPVDDSVSGVWRDRFIYLISGWSQKDNVSNVQIYEPEIDRWRQATPIPGPPVFGHAGGIVGDTIIYCDGAKVDSTRKPRFIISDGCYRGQIEPDEPTQITWGKLPSHPGGPRYRMAAGVIPEEERLVFTGGTGNPYNYNGVGYDGAPSEPSAMTFVYTLGKARWETTADSLQPTMDHRGLVGAGRNLYLIGGMSEKQKVIDWVQRFSFEKQRGSN